MNKGLKITLTVFLAILFSICIIINATWIIIKFFAPEKVVSNTYELGLQTINKGEELEESRYFAEIQLFRNEDGKGKSAFEIKYNYIMDENQTAFYSQGLQYTADSLNDLGWSFSYTEAEWDEKSQEEIKVTDSFLFVNILTRKEYYNDWFGNYIPNEKTTYTNYSSGNNFLTSTKSANPINDDTKFRVQIGDELYFMSFKSPSKIANDSNYVSRANVKMKYKAFWFEYYYAKLYSYLDYNYFSRLLFDSISSLPNGTTQAVVFEFGDLFDYYKSDGNGVYVQIDYSNSLKVKQQVTNYYAIKVTVNGGGLKKSSESLFNAVDGTGNYNSTGSYTSTTYFTGKTKVYCTLDDFTYVSTSDVNRFKLKLSSAFQNLYSEFGREIDLDVTIDLDKLSEAGIIFDGFVSDCFDGYSSVTTQTIGTPLDSASLTAEVVE